MRVKRSCCRARARYRGGLIRLGCRGPLIGRRLIKLLSADWLPHHPAFVVGSPRSKRRASAVARPSVHRGYPIAPERPRPPSRIVVVLPVCALLSRNVERVRSAYRHRLDPAGDVPDEPGQLARDRGRHLGQRLAGSAHPAIALAKPDLCLPADGTDRFRQAFAALLVPVLLPGLVPVAPAGFDQDRARLGVAGPGDPVASVAAAARVLARNQPKPGHELLGIGEAPQVADLGDEHRRCYQAQTTQGLQGPHERCQPPSADSLGQSRLEPLAACLALSDALLQLLDHELLVRALEALLAEPAPVRLAPVRAAAEPPLVA